MRLSPSPGPRPAPDPGEADGRFPVKNIHRWTILALALISLGGAGIVLISALDRASRTWGERGALAASAVLPIPLATSAALTAIGLGLLTAAWWVWNRRVHLFQDGLIYIWRFGRQVWRWDQVRLLYVSITRHTLLGLPLGTSCRCRLVGADGRRLRLDNRLRDMSALARVLGERTAPLQTGRALHAFEGGHALIFGPLRVERLRGLSWRGRAIHWRSIGRIQLRDGLLRVYRQGQSRPAWSIPAARLPNLTALLSVLGELVPVEAPEE